MFETKFGIENDMCVHKRVLDLFNIINIEMEMEKEKDKIDYNRLNVNDMSECDEWKTDREEHDDVMLK